MTTYTSPSRQSMKGSLCWNALMHSQLLSFSSGHRKSSWKSAREWLLLLCWAKFMCQILYSIILCNGAEAKQQTIDMDTHPEERRVSLSVVAHCKVVRLRSQDLHNVLVELCLFLLRRQNDMFGFWTVAHGAASWAQDREIRMDHVWTDSIHSQNVIIWGRYYCSRCVNRRSGGGGSEAWGGHKEKKVKVKKGQSWNSWWHRLLWMDERLDRKFTDPSGKFPQDTRGRNGFEGRIWNVGGKGRGFAEVLVIFDSGRLLLTMINIFKAQRSLL